MGVDENGTATKAYMLKDCPPPPGKVAWAAAGFRVANVKNSPPIGDWRAEWARWGCKWRT